jgi:DHA2 family multidrug resistance protein
VNHLAILCIQLTQESFRDATVEAYLRSMVEKAAFALSSNEAWALLAVAALLGLLLVPFAGPPPQCPEADARKH